MVMWDTLQFCSTILWFFIRQRISIRYINILTGQVTKQLEIKWPESVILYRVDMIHVSWGLSYFNIYLHGALYSRIRYFYYMTAIEAEGNQHYIDISVWSRYHAWYKRHWHFRLCTATHDYCNKGAMIRFELWTCSCLARIKHHHVNVKLSVSLWMMIPFPPWNCTERDI